MCVCVRTHSCTRACVGTYVSCCTCGVQRTTFEKRGWKECKRRRGRKIVLGAWHGCCTHELTAVVVAYTRPTQYWIHQHFIIECLINLWCILSLEKTDINIPLKVNHSIIVFSHYFNLLHNSLLWISKFTVTHWVGESTLTKAESSPDI